MYYNQSFDEIPEDMLLHGKLINDGGHNLFQRDSPPSFRKKRRRKYVDKEVEVDDSVFANAKQAVAPKEVKKDEIEESQHPPSEENIMENSPESVKNQAVEEESIAPQNQKDKPNKTHKMPLRKLFDELYDTWLSVKWKTRRNMLIGALKPYFENDYKKTVAFVDSNLDRRRHNTGSRFRRARNKCNLNRFNYFVTFTYNGEKRYRRFYKKFNSLTQEDKLSVINYLIFLYSEDFYCSETLKQVLKNDKDVKEITGKTTMTGISFDDIIKGDVFERIQKEYILNEYLKFPNFLSEKYKIQEGNL